MDWMRLSRDVLDGNAVSRDQALAMLDAPDDDLLSLLDAAFAIRRRSFGLGVSLHVIRNARSGQCSEDCSYCSQAATAASPIESYPLQTVEQILDGARQARQMKARRYCIVTSGREPSASDLDVICAAARGIKSEMSIELCASLGLLTDAEARQLRQSGVDRCNHNLETSERYYPRICSTHTFADRVATARSVKSAGLQLCSGGLIGVGESHEDRVALAFALRAVQADSIPVNFFDPRPGTPLAGHPPLRPTDGLRALAMFRFVHPEREVRVAGGRERCLGALQALALYAADSLFTSGYLTTPGQGYEADRKMIEAAGFHVVDITDA